MSTPFDTLVLPEIYITSWFNEGADEEEGECFVAAYVSIPSPDNLHERIMGLLECMESVQNEEGVKDAFFCNYKTYPEMEKAVDDFITKWDDYAASMEYPFSFDERIIGVNQDDQYILIWEKYDPKVELRKHWTIIENISTEAQDELVQKIDPVEPIGPWVIPITFENQQETRIYQPGHPLENYTVAVNPGSLDGDKTVDFSKLEICKKIVRDLDDYQYWNSGKYPTTSGLPTEHPEALKEMAELVMSLLERANHEKGE